MDKMKELKRELKGLLEKYKATIAFTCDSCSDWSGIYGESMEIYFQESGTYIEYKIENCSSFDASNL